MDNKDAASRVPDNKDRVMDENNDDKFDEFDDDDNDNNGDSQSLGLGTDNRQVPGQSGTPEPRDTIRAYQVGIKLVRYLRKVMSR